MANTKEIGVGTILAILGLTTGTAFLDIIYANPGMKYVLPLLEQGRMTASSPLIAAVMPDFVLGGVITQAQADALVGYGYDSVPVSWQECQTAFEQNGV